MVNLAILEKAGRNLAKKISPKEEK